MKKNLFKTPLLQSSNPLVVSLISLGCAKNTVDSELILGGFVESGWLIAEEPRDADICLVNTCGFIQDARDEAAGVLNELRDLKNAGGRPRAVVALGCLVKRAAGAPELSGALAAADAQFAFSDYSRLPEICAELLGLAASKTPAESYNEFLLRPRLRIGSPHMAYLKISEGCSNPCRFCSIPKIRGKQVSRPMNDIINEARTLIDAGAVELNLIAQDTTAYGKDISRTPQLHHLLKRLRDEISDDVWFRIMYACPQHLTRDVLDVMASDERFCRYIDMPLQHISDNMLDAMGRMLTKKETIEKLDLIEIVLPGAAIRTAFITGHPGETEADFKELLSFINEGRFTHAGVFTYSPEPGTLSAKMKDAVPEKIKAERRDRLMSAQQKISAARCAARIGTTVEVMVDAAGDDCIITRSQLEAPEVDGVIFVADFDAVAGDRYDAKIINASEYDLVAEII